MADVELQAVFAVFDKDNDGFISMDEVTAVLASMGVHASPEYISDIFNQVDLDGNKSILSAIFSVSQMINWSWTSERRLVKVNWGVKLLCVCVTNYKWKQN